jgi:hypothetical protein
MFDGRHAGVLGGRGTAYRDEGFTGGVGYQIKMKKAPIQVGILKS